jgi:hypothetical protein
LGSSRRCRTITIDGNKAGEGRIAKAQPGIFSVDDLADIGTDDGTPVTDYGKSRKFTCTLNKVLSRRANRSFPLGQPERL